VPKDQAEEIERTFARAERAVMRLEGVNGVALGEESGKPCIVVYVDRATPELRRRVVAVCKDMRLRLEESGPFQAQ